MPDLEHGHRRLLHLYEISKLLSTFESIEKTLDAVLSFAAETLALRSAILIEQREGDSRMIVWSLSGQDAASVSAAKAHVESAFRYLAGDEGLVLREQAGTTELPAPLVLEAESVKNRFIVMPLVIARRIVGALQFEGAAPLAEDDLVFVNAIANQLALALDRHRAWARDVTRREDAEARIERFQALVDNLDRAFLWEADATTLELLYVSAHVENLLGFPRREWVEVRRSWSERVHPDDWEALSGAFHRARTGKTNQRCTHRCIASDGRQLWFHTGVHLAETDAGAPHLQGVSVDITERVQAEQAQRFLLRASRTLGATLDYSSLLGHLTRLGIPQLGDLCILDIVADGEIVRAAWAHVDRKDEGRLDELFEDSPSIALAKHPLSQAILGGGTELAAEIDARLVRELGVHSLLRVPVMLGDRILGALSFAFGRSKRRHTETDVMLAEELGRRGALALENARLFDEAQRAIRLREEILGVVSHDLKNPLASILMVARYLAKGDFSDQGQADVSNAAGRIERAAKRMHRLIDDLVDFASIQAEHLSIAARPNDGRTMLEETVVSFEVAASERRVGLSAEADPDLPQVDCDRDRVLQVLFNLVGNAVKATRDGFIHLRAAARGSEVVFTVSDTGTGISDQDLAHVFDRYWRGQARYQGTGLGLTIARGIVEAHGGRIWAESKLGEGTTFSFTLPVSTTSSQAPDSPGSRPGSSDRAHPGEV